MALIGRLISLALFLLFCAVNAVHNDSPEPFLHHASLPTPRFSDECIDNIECAPTQFCNVSTFQTSPDCINARCRGPPNRCVKRTGLGTKCTIGGGECTDGLYCAFGVRGAMFDPSCAPQIAKGKRCRLDATRPCQGDLVCDRFRLVCDVMTTGVAGDSCEFDRDCMQEAGFYCKNDPRGRRDGVCTKKRAAGKVCDRAADNNECLGFCANRGGNGGVCVTRREVGETCSDDANCIVVRTVFDSRNSQTLCNHGKCAKDISLLRIPGMRCNPKTDLCDARRNLKCGRFRGKNVCLQRSLRNGLCTSGSKFSSCDIRVSGVPLECRRERSRLGNPLGVERCRQVVEVVKRGEICNLREYAACEDGTVCTTGPGIRRYFPFRGDPLPPLSYCMKTVPVDSDCSSKFDTVCEEGSFCINNLCKMGTKAPKVPITLSGPEVPCDSQNCAPGLVCAGDSGSDRCDVPTVTAKVRQPCFETATKKKKCETGSFCTRGPKRHSVKRCRPPAMVGGLCETNDGCIGRLKCGPEVENVNRCYDPRKSLRQGAACSPSAGRREKSCVVDKFGRATMCLAKGMGFACQVEVKVFQPCKPKKNTACGSGLTCGKNAICVPSSE